MPTTLSLRPVSVDERDELDSLKDRLLALEVKEGSAAAIADGSITNAKLADMAQATVKGRASGAGTGAPQDLTANQVNAIVGSADLFNPSNTVTLGAGSDEGRGQTGTPLPLKVKGSSLLLYRESADAQPPNFEFLKRRSGTGTVLQNGDMLGSIVWTGADGNTFGAIGAIIRAEVDGTPGSADMPGRIVFLTTPDGSGTPAESFRITNGQNLVMADGKRIEADEARARDSGGLLLRDDGGNLGIFIQDGGNVGIGTASPEVALHVERATPAIMLRRTNNNNAAYVVFKNSGISEIWRIGHRAGSADNNLYLDREAGAGHIVLGLGTTSGANVGIGALVPSSSLHVTAPAISGAESIARFDVSDDTSFLRIENVTGAANAFIPSVTTYQSSTLIARFDLARIEIDTGTNPVYVFDGRTAAGAAITTRPLADWRNFGSSRMLLTASGRLGIGVASPQGQLHGHDGTGGFGHFTKTGIVGSAQTIIPDGVGDVTKSGSIIGSASTTDGAINTTLFNSILNGANTDITPDGGTNTLRFSVAANGAFTVVRQAGTKTWEISIWAVWR